MQRDQRADPPRGAGGSRTAVPLVSVALGATLACEVIFRLPALAAHRPPVPLALLLDVAVAILAIGAAYVCLVHRRLRARALDLERLSAAEQAVLSCVDPQLLSRTITSAARELSRADRAVLFQVGGQTEFLRIVSSTGTTRDDDPESVIGALAVTKRQPVWTGDMPDDDRLSLSQEARERARRQSLKACLALPILTESGDVFGTLTLCYEKPHAFSDRDVRLLQSFGIQAGAALEKTRALERLAMSARSDRLLRQFFERLVGEASEASALDEAARIARELLRADIADVLLRVPDTGALRLEAGCGWEADDVDRAVSITGDSIAGRAIKRGEIIQVDDSSRERGSTPPPYLLAHGVRAAIVAPLTVAGEVVGALGVYYRTRRELTDEERRAFAQLADHVGLALSKMRRAVPPKPDLSVGSESVARPVEADKLAVVAALLSRMAHELNNPLTSILLSAQVGKQQATEGDLVRRRMEAIEQESKRAAKIVKDLLGVVRRRAPTLVTTDVNEAIKTALQAHAPAFDLEGIRVEMELHALPTVAADAGQIQQALSNLFTNAAHAMKSAHGKGTLLVRSFTAGSELCAEVQDDGPGIPRDLLARIFEPFFTTKPAGEGTGLGLNVVTGIVEAHGGRMDVENVPTGGARFTIRLPLGAPLPSAAASPPQAQPVERRTTRILVVDDEDSLRDIVTEILTAAGHDVATAATGREATEMLARDRFDVVILDLRLPDLDGREIWQWLVARNDVHRSRIVFMTGDVVSADTERFLRGTGRPVLSKPATIERVYTAIDGVIAANGPVPALAAP